MIEDAEVVAHSPAPVDPEQERLVMEAMRAPTALATRGPVYEAEQFMFDPDAFAHAQRIAMTVAANSMLPKHLIGKTAKETIANVMFLVADAQRWRTNPWALMGECYPKPGGGGMAYQGKVFSGLITKFLGVRLNYRYSGKGELRACAAYGTIPGETAERTTPPVIFKEAVTHDKDGQVKAAWRNDPDVKLSYNAVMRWARMHASELVTGVITAEEAELMAEERRATLPATPTPGETPRVLAEFIAASTHGGTAAPVPTRQEDPGRSGVAAPAGAPPTAAGPPPGPPGASSEPLPNDPAPQRSIAELRRLAKENNLAPEDLETLCRSVSHGLRGVSQITNGDCTQLVQEILHGMERDKAT